jgi:hypothetical protein
MQTILDILKKAGGWHHGFSLKIENPSQKPNPFPRPRKRPSSPSFEGRRTCRLSFPLLQNRAGRHRFGFSLHPRFPLPSGPRSPAARQHDVRTPRA